MNRLLSIVHSNKHVNKYDRRQKIKAINAHTRATEQVTAKIEFAELQGGVNESSDFQIWHGVCFTNLTNSSKVYMEEEGIKKMDVPEKEMA